MGMVTVVLRIQEELANQPHFSTTGIVVFCVKFKFTKKTFEKYIAFSNCIPSSNGDDMNDSYDDDGNDFNPVLDKNGIIGLALGGVTLLAILSVFTNLVYQNWWTIQFKYARWKWQKSITTAVPSWNFQP